MQRIAFGVVFASMIAFSGAQDKPKYSFGFNKVEFIESMHFNPRPIDALVDTVILHHTAGPTTASCVDWFLNPESKVSSHYVVGPDGSIIQMVNTFYRAWHAGASKDSFGRENVNNFSIGIEIVNVGDGKHDYPADQVKAVRNLVGYLCRTKYRGQIKQISSHEYIAVPPGRKNDPINYPWSSLYDLSEQLQIPLIYGRTDQTVTRYEPWVKR